MKSAVGTILTTKKPKLIPIIASTDWLCFCGSMFLPYDDQDRSKHVATTNEHDYIQAKFIIVPPETAQLIEQIKTSLTKLHVQQKHSYINMTLYFSPFLTFFNSFIFKNIFRMHFVPRPCNFFLRSKLTG